MVKLTSWGRLNFFEHTVLDMSSLDKFPKQLTDSAKCISMMLPRGNAKSYGDVCLNEKGILLTTLYMDNFIDFNLDEMTITVQSGVLLRDIQRFLVKFNLMLPVTPGTQMITVGGAIANDVHCKNHHKFGTFGNHVKSIKLLRSSNELITCSLDENEGFFRATIGGLGLTGFITEATLKLKKIPGVMIEAENVPYNNLDEFFELAHSSVENYEHTVSWIDCISGNGQRGIFMRGNHSSLNTVKVSEPKLSVPLVPPISLVNQISLFSFNKFYYMWQSLKKNTFYVHYEKFFYQLDQVFNWNKIYGPKGFFQYQCVIPSNNAQDAIKEIQRIIAKSGSGSFLGVLKTFGDYKSLGILSFPFEGVTYALDFPNKGRQTEKIFEALDDVVLNSGGRLYLAKDARQPKFLFEKGYGHLMEEFYKYRDPMFSSNLSRRLMGF